MIRRPPRSTLFPHDALPISSTNRWTWSGRIPRAMTSARYLAAVLCINPSNRFSTPPARKLCGGTWGTKERDICHCKLFDLYTSIIRSEEHTSELQSRLHLVCRLLLEKKKLSRQYLMLR